MKKSFRKALFCLAVLMLLSSLMGIFASAASYPLIYCTNSGAKFVKGTIGEIEFSIWHEYKNEGYDIYVYDEYGTLVATASDTMYNVNYSTDLTITVNTSNYDVGKYTVKYQMSFYTRYEWYYAPNQYTAYFYVIEDKCNGSHTFGQQKTVTESTCEKKGTAEKTCQVCGYVEQIELPIGTHATSTGNYYKDSDDQHYYYCSECFEKIYENHTWDNGTIITNPTSNSNGTAEYECTKCNHTVTKEVPKYSLGDVNLNGGIDMTDYILLKRAYFGTYTFNDAQKMAGDINKNGNIDMTDYILLKRVYFGTYNLDGSPSNNGGTNKPEVSVPETNKPVDKNGWDKLRNYLVTNCTKDSSGDYGCLLDSVDSDGSNVSCYAYYFPEDGQISLMLFFGDRVAFGFFSGDNFGEYSWTLSIDDKTGADSEYMSSSSFDASIFTDDISYLDYDITNMKAGTTTSGNQLAVSCAQTLCTMLKYSLGDIGLTLDDLGFVKY